MRAARGINLTPLIPCVEPSIPHERTSCDAGQQKTEVVSGTLKANGSTTMAITVPKDAVSPSLMLKVYRFALIAAN